MTAGATYSILTSECNKTYSPTICENMSNCQSMDYFIITLQNDVFMFLMSVHISHFSSIKGYCGTEASSRHVHSDW